MDDGYSLLSILVFIGFIMLDAVFYGFGSAIQNINVGNLEKLEAEGDEKAVKLLNIINYPDSFVNGIQIMTHLISMITGAFVFFQIKKQLTFPLLWMSAASYIITVLVLLLILTSFGIVIPKHFAAHNPEKWSNNMYSTVSAVIFLLKPFILAVTGISYLALKLAGIDPNAETDNVTEEDIMSMVNEGHEKGVLEASEAEMITNIFEFDDKEASDIMTHRKNMVVLDAETTLKDAVSFILKEGNNSRYPVCGEDIDDIIGLLYMKDALIYSEGETYNDKSLKDIPGILREAHFIPETRNINSLFKEMQSKKIHMEIVVDEYGQTAGLVTMEDILEEIVGNIMDEYDVDEEFIVEMEEGIYTMNGMTPLSEAAKTLNIEFTDEEYDTYDTINGFLISKLGRIPQEDEKPELSCSGYLFEILKIENKIIQTVRASIINEEHTEQENDKEE